MTKLSYNICLNGRKVKNVVGYQEACNIVTELGHGWSMKPVYTYFDSNDTPERLKWAKEHAAKVAEAMVRKGQRKTVMA